MKRKVKCKEETTLELSISLQLNNTTNETEDIAWLKIKMKYIVILNNAICDQRNWRLSDHRPTKSSTTEQLLRFHIHSFNSAGGTQHDDHHDDDDAYDDDDPYGWYYDSRNHFFDDDDAFDDDAFDDDVC